MEEFIALLYAIRFYSKDIHYSAKGVNFWSDHEFADEIYDGLDDFIDQINEKVFLGNGKEAPSSKVVLEKTIDIIPDFVGDTNGMWVPIKILVDKSIEIIDLIKQEYTGSAISALLDNIADDLQKKRGLINRRIM